ncbi:Processive diacylglycerol beta-glucosyltransferase [Thalictrum thalictroides]|uniref:Processive diacylglycerol beta-glucosyltransferase n=1 Tax=Thalictrum thalictroides TaxID=46969 RepID=A0A7J6VW31_THATH|nr:Processive diacylglycerol beta-glucosyltransferase [Thalictrum thalictroides]
MVPKPFSLKKPTEHQSTTQEAGNRKQLHSEIREMTSAITHHLNDLHHTSKSSSAIHHDGTEDDQGVRIITLAGTNTGAAMQGELDEISNTDDDKTFTTYTNSNFQAINNSIMIGGSYTCKDPGVHIETCIDFTESNEHKEVKPGKKGKKQLRHKSKSDNPSDGSGGEGSVSDSSDGRP